MTDNPFLDDDDNDADPGKDQSGSALRRFGKEQQKRADELQKQLDELTKKLAAREAADVFAKLGIDEKIRKFYSGEPTEEGITEWWKENAEVFGVEPSGDDVTQTDEQRQQAADLAAVQQLQGFGQERPDATSREAMSETRKGLLSNKTATEADFNAALAKLGVPDLPLMAPQF